MTSTVGAQAASGRRTVIFGANGFIGRSVAKTLISLRHHICCLGSNELNLLSASTEEIAAVLRHGDRVVFLSALTPDRANDTESLKKNVKMAKAFLDAAKMRQLDHVVYVSTDGVYPFGVSAVSENTSTDACDAYTQAHLQRESMFVNTFSSALCIVRPTQAYGPGDPHMSYGPSRFYRDASVKGRITLFGNGEEMRDHISVYDVASLICRLQAHRQQGVFNLATGVSRTFMEVAEIVAEAAGIVQISCEPRIKEVTHRYFNVTKLKAVFPDYIFRDLNKEIRLMVHAR